MESVQNEIVQNIDFSFLLLLTLLVVGLPLVFEPTQRCCCGQPQLF